MSEPSNKSGMPDMSEIDRLEKILNSESDCKVRITPDGRVVDYDDGEPGGPLWPAPESKAIAECRPVGEIGKLEAELSRLRKENAELRAALEPFAKEFDGYHQGRPEAENAVRVAGVTVGDLRRARSAFHEAPTP